jgi:hypothetical protein
MWQESGIFDRVEFRLHLLQQYLDEEKITQDQFDAIRQIIVQDFRRASVRQLINEFLDRANGRQQLYKSGQITKEQLKFMTDLGIYTLRELKINKEPPFRAEREFQNFQRAQLLKEGLITKEEYELMRQWGITNKQDIEWVKEILAEIEKEERMEKAKQARDDLLKKGKITKDEHAIMVAQNLTTIEELRAIQDRKRELEEQKRIYLENRQNMRNNYFKQGYITQEGLDLMNTHDMTTMWELKRAIDAGWAGPEVLTGKWVDKGYNPSIVESPKIYKDLPQIPGLYEKNDEVVFYPAPIYKYDVYKRYFKNPKASKLDKYKQMLKNNDPISVMPLYEKVKRIVEDPDSYTSKKVPAKLKYPQKPPFEYPVSKPKVRKPKAKPEPYPKFEIQEVDVPEM